MNDTFLDKKLDERRAQQALRRLRLPEGKVDFCSNDYLGIITLGLIEKELSQKESGEKELGGKELGEPVLDGREPGEKNLGGHAHTGPGVAAHWAHGSGGSRLLAGNYSLIAETEKSIAAFHAADAGILFNSGYDANLGVMGSIPQKGDVVLYDELSHASIRDGMRLSFARNFSFAHNDCAALIKKLEQLNGDAERVFVVTESVFSMDGDLAPLKEMVDICGRYGAFLVVDEAHATGVVGKEGCGLVQELGLEKECFARIHTFGKAVGCHGAIVLGSQRLVDYLVNFCRPLIYTTALPPASVEAIAIAYRLFPGMDKPRQHLQELIERFHAAPIGYERLQSRTSIQVVIVPGNEAVRALADTLQNEGLDVRPILYPTVPKGRERLRIVLHAFNTVEEVDRLMSILEKNKPAHC